MKTILVTGGAGYIGSHTCLELLENDFQVVVIDNLSNSKITSISRIEELTQKKIHFVEGDIKSRSDILKIFQGYEIDAVIHFAGLKAASESIQIPTDYYQNNVLGTLNLLDVMNRADVKKMVYSSSATVYGSADIQPIAEDQALAPINPYGRSKMYAERILNDLSKSDDEWNISVLRYFNPVGAHKSGRIGEDPNGTPNNLLPILSQVALGRKDQLQIFGGDYPTKDGTGVRDYIHVVDLAYGHILALEKLRSNPRFMLHNLGSGFGYSVLEVLKAFERVIGKDISYRIVGKREGDVSVCYADVTRAENELGWKVKENLVSICEDTWNWLRENPEGYGTG